MKISTRGGVKWDLLHALKYLIAVRQIKCLHKHPGPDEACAKCVADEAIRRAEAQ